jgi:hypothetical protein
MNAVPSPRAKETRLRGCVHAAFPGRWAVMERAAGAGREGDVAVNEIDYN